MHKNIILVCVLLILSLSSVSCMLRPFTKGNLVALKKSDTPIKPGAYCAAGGLLEFTPSGQIVQQVFFPTTATDETPACLLFPQTHQSHVTLSSDGFRAIIPCCNVVQDTTTSSTSTMISFAIVYGDGRIEITPILNDTLGNLPINAVLDGNDIWYIHGGFSPKVMYMAHNATSPIQIFAGNLFSLKIHEGNLYGSNYFDLGGALARFDGLPREPAAPTILLNSFEVYSFYFIGTDLVAVMVDPKRFQIYNLNSGALVRDSADAGTSAILQFVPMLEQNKVIAQNRPSNGKPWIYALVYNQTADSYTRFDSVKPLVGATGDNFFLCSPIPVPTNSCADGVKNNDETDVDCGGSFCPQRCDSNQRCRADSDCLTNGCTNNICNLPPTPPQSVPVVAEPISSTPSTASNPDTPSTPPVIAEPITASNPVAEPLATPSAPVGTIPSASPTTVPGTSTPVADPATNTPASTSNPTTNPSNTPQASLTSAASLLATLSAFSLGLLLFVV